MNWLITGGCGFLGVNLVRHLAEGGGEKIVVLDDLSVGTRDALSGVCSFIALEPFGTPPFDVLDEDHPVGLMVGDILDGTVAASAAKGADIIVHLAANTGVLPSVDNPRRDMELNVIGTFHMLEAARQNAVKRFVFASSGAPAGEVEPPIHEDLAPRPVSPYGASKLAGEGYCSAYAGSFGIETVGLRFSNVYGPRSSHKNSVIARFLRQALDGTSLEVYGDGLQTRDFVYVDDLVDAILKAARTEGVGGQLYQIATGSETTIRELVTAISETFEEAGMRPPNVAFTEPLKGEVRRNFADNSKARRQLGWQPTVALPKGLRSTLSYFLGVDREWQMTDEGPDRMMPVRLVEN